MHQAQADTQAALRAVQRAVSLREQIENVRQQFRRNADAAVTHPQHGGVASTADGPLDGQRYAAPVLGVFGGVGQQVNQHLFQSRGVSPQADRLKRHRHRQFMPVLRDQRLRRLHRALDDAAEHDLLLPKLNPAGADARDLQQVIDQMFELPDLTLDDAAGLLLKRVFIRLQPQQVDGVQDWRQRVAQLVAEHGQKFIFAPVQISQRLGLLECLALQPTAFGNVIKAGDGASDLSLAIQHRNDIDHQIDARAVEPLDHDFHVVHRGCVALQNSCHRAFRVRDQGAIGQISFERTAKFLVGIPGPGFPPPQLHGTAVVFLNHSRAVARVHGNRPPIEQCAETFFAFAKGLFGFFLFGDVVKKDGNFSAVGSSESNGIEVEPAVHRFHFVGNPNRLARQRNFAVSF